MLLTIVHQQHLSPLPLPSSNVFWDYEDVLHLNILPHAIVLGDRQESYCDSYHGCKFLQPGPFAANFQFITYYIGDQGEISRV
jgi:DNA polymerase epsilon subunit 2